MKKKFFYFVVVTIALSIGVICCFSCMYKRFFYRDEVKISSREIETDDWKLQEYQDFLQRFRDPETGDFKSVSEMAKFYEDRVDDQLVNRVTKGARLK